MNQSIILFDGICNLCNGFVQFVIKRDTGNRFLFASLQSDEGKNILKNKGVDSDKNNTVVLIENEKVYKRSAAVLRICRHLRGGIKMLYGFMVIPAFVRDIFYNIIARNRYSWFGKRNKCMVPSPTLQKKFLTHEYQQKNTGSGSQREPRTLQ